MKNILVLIVSVLVSQVTLASKTYLWPAVGSLLINNACATETHFNSVSDVKSCAETAVNTRTACTPNGQADFCRPLGLKEKAAKSEIVTETFKCVKYDAKKISVPRTTKAKHCVKWVTDDVLGPQCLEYETVTSILGKVFKVEVYSDGPDAEQRFEGYLNYTIPDCLKQ